MQQEYQRQIYQIEEEIEKKTKYKGKTYQNFVEEIITKKEYLTYSKKYETEIICLQERLKELNGLLDEQSQLESQYDAWVEEFKNYINVNELTRDIVLELIEKIEVNEDGSITIFYRFSNPYAGDINND